MNFLLRYGGRHARLVGLDPEDLITKVISQTSSFYEIELLAEMFHRALPGWVFVDAGAHVGNHSVFFGAILGLEGYAIEQNVKTFDILQRNLVANQLQDRIRAINAALGSQAGRARTVQSDTAHNSGMDRVELSMDGPLEVVTLDSLRLPRLDLLKIDVEGFEIECLRGAQNTIARCNPLIVAEAISPENFQAQSQFLEPFGYVPVRRFNVTPTYIYEKRL
ncbi:MAG: FkbM family methyltransferase [Paracoccus sp. (in: a-proteobacteria)]|nr:FkbM family methyltransferase [Paracoccus sp. (in: a-proteobacteria)]